MDIQINSESSKNELISFSYILFFVWLLDSIF